MSNSGSDLNSHSGLTELIGARRKLSHEWLQCQAVWRDRQARAFDAEVVSRLVTESRNLSIRFNEYLGAISRLRSIIRHSEITDPFLDIHEVESRQNEAQAQWHRTAGGEKSRFAVDFGQFAHERYAQEIIAFENSRGRRRNLDYAVEYSLAHPDGGTVRLDYVDLQNHHIVDFKSVQDGQAGSQLANSYAAQRQRHVEAYAAQFGVVPTYEYRTYRSSKDLYSG